MTTSSTSNFELTRDQLIRRGLQMAGLLATEHNPDADDISYAADILHMELLSLQAEGIVVTWVERTLQVLVASTASYSLASDTLDVAIDPNNIAGTIVPSSGAETPVSVMSRAEYINLSSKTIEGTPTKVFVERLATVALTFWPIPSEAVSFRYGKIRFPRDLDTGARTLDLSRRWHKAIARAIAYEMALAKSMALERVGFLKKAAEEAKRAAMLSDVEKGHAQFYVPRSRYY